VTAHGLVVHNLRQRSVDNGVVGRGVTLYCRLLHLRSMADPLAVTATLEQPMKIETAPDNPALAARSQRRCRLARIQRC